MIQELAAESGDVWLVIGAMLLFLGIFLVIVVRTWRVGKAETEARARLPLDDGTPTEGRDAKHEDAADGDATRDR